MTGKARVRFAPSPTGSLHIGGAHTALFNWLYARRNGGSFILRIEDTDMERSTKEYEQSILDGMRWMGLDWDEGPDKGGDFGPYRQSERMDLYRKYAKQLLDEGKAYEKDGAVFFKVVPGKELRFRDEVYGNLDFKSENASVNHDGTIKDIVIMKRDGMPTYNYAVVIDDYTMGINMVIRGEDHIINTPKQLLIYDALGFEAPGFAHLPMILGKDKKKLSKRQGATSVFEYNDMGYLPDGVFNFLALLGWSPKNGQEIFSREEAVEMFDISAVTRKAAVLDMDKLNHINQEQMKIMDPMKLLAVIRPFWIEMGFDLSGLSDEYLASALHTMGGRGQTTKQLAEYSDYFVTFDVVKARYDASEIKEETRAVVKKFYNALLSECAEWKADKMEEFTKEWIAANDSSMKEVCLPLRWALTGRKVSPGVFEVAEQLGRDECRRRLEYYDLV
ncbi:glutamate--tRNA ligase family protein [Cloacibacillus sp. An23]|uniref:glutamate--tRNA ligase n=1 Tax=Cloacibacillus sp. An23 TaxID=1965591 RepID=UPI000B39437B|nr:glutamate--tRNA ligase family protein [Cloacibacillus sp. An23]OUO94663.1 glutamate--tRNA ligase [Cloacibacillus sp. An23]